MEQLEGRVAVVTGAASGLGFGIASAFADAGMRLMLADVDESRVGRKTAELEATGAEVASHVVDVGDAAAVDELAGRTYERFGAAHVVCNDAGIIRRGFTTWELPVEEWHQIIRVNLLGVFHGIRSFVPLMLESEEPGHIVNIASAAAVMSVPGLSPYTASKHGVLGLSEALHGELQQAGAPIGVTIVMPGLVRTRIGQAADAPDPEGPLEPGQMDPGEAGRIVVGAVRADRLHCFTHPEMLDGIRARFARITDAG
jgi:NAD(P)-dependent dehydrogenase (short-subunit alcohol dehydrogenase family)